MKKIQASCSRCQTETCHTVLRSVEREIPRSWWPEDRELLFEPEPGSVDWKPDSFELIECAGCKTVSFAHRYIEMVWSYEWNDTVLEEHVEYYPSSPPFEREKPPWIGNPCIPSELRNLLDEIYDAVCAGQHRLALMGIRALLEQVLIDKVGDHQSFKRNLDAICRAGFISSVQRDTLTTVLDAGHAATHRMYVPSEAELNLALDISEGVIESIYVHVDAASELTNLVPVRRKTGKVVPWKVYESGEPTSPDDGGEDP